MIKKIVNSKDPILRQKAKPVKKIDKKVLSLADDLVDTLRKQKNPEGVGLAAPQIAKSLRIFAMAWKNDFRVIINPEILSVEKKPKKKNGKQTKEKTILEGCLSIPNIYGPLKRPQRLKLKYIDLKGKIQIETFEGFSAQIVQHEVDHLNGVLFIDNLIKNKKPLYKFNTNIDDWEEVELI